MGKEKICKYFTENSPCGFARWLIQKPYQDIHQPEVGCGKNDIESCFRKKKLDSNILDISNEFTAITTEEWDIALPRKYTDSKNIERRLPGGTHK